MDVTKVPLSRAINQCGDSDTMFKNHLHRKLKLTVESQEVALYSNNVQCLVPVLKVSFLNYIYDRDITSSLVMNY